MNTKKLKGLSLLELVIVIAIISILATLALFSTGKFRGYLEKQELSTIVLGIKQTKNMALSSRTRHSISFEDRSYKSSINEETIDLKYLELVRKGSNTLEFIFTEKGRPAMDDANNPTAGTIVFKGLEKTYTITLQPVTGKTKVVVNGQEES